jgi:tRNA A-37 threonylcarbamoyl transferase component Bud32
MSGQRLPTLGDLPALLVRQVELICTRFEQNWAHGQRPAIEEHLLEASNETRGVLLAELLRLDVTYRRRAGEVPQAAEYQQRLPEDALLVEAVLAVALRGKPAVAGTVAAEEPGVEKLPSRPPETASPAPATPEPDYVPETRLPEASATGGAPSGLPPRLPEPEYVPEMRLPDAAQGPSRAGLVEVPGYEILSQLGKGGMGVVYKARHQQLKRVVALKMILHGEHASKQEHRRFLAEAEAVARLQHPHVVQIFDVGECAGLPYFALEYCDGGSLADNLDGTPWEVKRAARLVETLARAIHTAHTAGLVHRDLKPANVLMAADGTPKVTDFGLVKRLDQQGRTRTGAVMGTPSYMAPEQARGKKDVGPAADVYALGAMLYELLVGRPPFRAANPLDTLQQVVHDEPVPVRRLQPKVPRNLGTICHKCLQKDPKKRYRSAAALAADLERFQAGESVQARPLGPFGRLQKSARRRPATALLVLLTALMGLAGWWANDAVDGAMRQQRQNQLMTVHEADLTALRIWMGEQAVNAQLLANDENLLGPVRALLALAEAQENSQRQLVQAKAQTELQARLIPRLKVRESPWYFVVSPAGVILAADQDAPIGKPLTTERNEFFERIMAGTPSVSKPYRSALLHADARGELRANLPTMLAAALIRDKTGKPLAALVVGIRPDDHFTRILQVARSGKTGETLAFDRNGLLLSQSRFDDDLKQIGLLADTPDAQSILTVELRDPGVNMMKGGRPALRRTDQPLTRIAADAAAGSCGIDVEGHNDYRGVPVIGAWTWLPEYDFGVMTTEDVAEAFRPLYILRKVFGVLVAMLALSAVAIIGLTWFVARKQRALEKAELAAGAAVETKMN